MARGKARRGAFGGIVLLMFVCIVAFGVLSLAANWLMAKWESARDEQSRESGEEAGKGFVDGIVEGAKDYLGIGNGASPAQQTSNDPVADEQTWAEWAADKAGDAQDYVSEYLPEWGDS